jgi:hypothetical protein
MNLEKAVNHGDTANTAKSKNENGFFNHGEHGEHREKRRKTKNLLSAVPPCRRG